MPQWLILVTSLPTTNATVRMRIWRALKGLGCGVLRDGVYLLPDGAGAKQALQGLAAEVTQAGGSARLLPLGSLDSAQDKAFRELFERSADYARLKAGIDAFRAGLAGLDPAAAKRMLNRLSKDFAAVAGIDYFPGAARQQAEAALAQAAAELDARGNPDEPRAAAGTPELLDRTDYRGRRWATRKKPWVDRLASAWLIRRFIDPDAGFVWLDKPHDCPPDALGFDFDGARFTHMGARVTFEVLLASFGLEADQALLRVGALVRYLDVGGIPVAEAAGVELILRGARQSCADDDALLAEAARIFDQLHAAFAQQLSEKGNRDVQ
jgi:hypothetical protein